MKRRTPPRRPPVIPRLSETFLGGLPHDSRDALLADVSVHAVDAGGAILPAAVSEARVGVVLEGIARSFLTAADGRQLTVRYARPGAIIGRRAEAVGDHAPLRTQAVTDCMILELNAAHVARLIRADAAVASALVGELSRRLEDVYATVAAHAFGSMRERIARHLLDLAGQGDADRGDPGHGLTAAVTQQQLADGVGTVREVVARELRELRREGFITTRPGIIEINDAAELASLAGPWGTASRSSNTGVTTVAEAFLDASPHAIVGVEPGGTITYANPSAEATFGWSRDELIGAPVTRLLPERLAERHEMRMAAFMGRPAARPMGVGLDLQGRRKDGTEFPVEISLAPVESPSGPVVFATVVDLAALAPRSRGIRVEEGASPVARPRQGAQRGPRKRS